jgi:aminopeptidase N
VPGLNLTRVEALTRSHLITVKSYQVELDLSEVATLPSFRSTTRIEFHAEPGEDSFIDAVASTVHSITLNGTALDPDDVFSDSRISLPSLRSHNTLEVVADFLYTNTGEGLHRFVDPVDQEIYLYTQFEVPDSRRVFAVFEQPDLKASFQFTIHAPATWQVISNQPTPEPQVSDSVGTWSFSPTPRISSYITALIAGPYRVVRDELTSSSGKKIPLGVFARASLFDYLDADYIFDITKKGFSYFEEKFRVPYPFEKYDQLFVPEFNAGAMENAGAVTFAESYVFRSHVSDAVRERRVVTILHELAHMWFGDLVTMRWWNDLWLNESFAEWASTIATAEATEWTEAWTTFHAMEKNWAYRQDQLPSTHPIVAAIRDIEDVQVNFDGITYAKGGSVLKQLFAWVGREAFFDGVHNYFLKHQWGNTVLSDFLEELEDTSGRDLSLWSKVWLETAGVNTLSPQLALDNEGIITSFALVQKAPEDWPTLRPHRLAIGFYSRKGDTVERVHRLELDVEGPRTVVQELVGMKRPDMILPNDDDLAYAKIRLDDESVRFARENLQGIHSPLARALVWGSIWDETRDAERKPQDFIDLVLGNVSQETESTTVRTVLGQLALVVRNYLDPARRDQVMEEVATALFGLAQAAQPGSDIQFQLTKAFAGLACTGDHQNILTSLRTGSMVLEGLVMSGGAGSEEIELALAADNTSNGQQAAARARALLPTVEAKRAVFNELVNSTSVPNAIVRSLSMGFDVVTDQSLLEPLVDDYFASLERVWAERTYKIAEYIVEGLYPGSLVSADLVRKTRQWLDSHPDHPALRRMVQEALAGVERALRVQAVDAKA